MPDTDGVTLLKEWATTGQLTMPVIMMSGHATIETAVEATKIGALAFLEKPVTLQKLLKAVEQGLIRSKPRKLEMSASISAGTGGGANQAHAGSDAQSADDGKGPKQTFDLDRQLRDVRDEFERAYFEFHLQKEAGSMTKVAERTGLERTHLYRKLKQLGVDATRGKRSGI
jgi:DNA-binding NtrC family response regulator